MPHRVKLFICVAIGIISSANLALIALSNSPYDASQAVLWSFFGSLFLASTVILGLAWYGLKLFLARRRRTTVSLFTSLRQTGLLSLITVLALFFNSLNILRFWDIIPLAIAAVLVEFFFQADKKPRATIEHEPAE